MSVKAFSTQEETDERMQELMENIRSVLIEQRDFIVKTYDLPIEIAEKHVNDQANKIMFDLTHGLHKFDKLK